MRRRDRLMSALFSFYFAQCGTGLTVFFVYVLLRHQGMSSVPAAIVITALAGMIVVGLGLMTCMSIDPHRPHYMLMSVPALLGFYGTMHVALGGPPEPRLLLGMLLSALAHLLVVWLVWHRSEPAMNPASESG